jgi:shikimate dehydrogenase
MRKKLGVIGHPIRHSLSPAMHNAVFKHLKLEYEYDAYDVLEEELAGKLLAFKEQGFVGINVTIPHKVAVVPYLDKLSDEAKLTGAVNTIKFGREAIGYNTDGIGCVRSFEEAGIVLQGKRVLILGAGGAARAIAFQLAKEKTVIMVTDRVTEKAVKLAKDVEKKANGKITSIESEDGSIERAMGQADIVINATPIGMLPNIDETPINPKLLHKKLTVMDIVYNPIETKFLKEARKIGCLTLDGIGMFVNQGAESLRIWLGIEPPLKLMRDVVVQELKKR